MGLRWPAKEDARPVGIQLKEDNIQGPVQERLSSIQVRQLLLNLVKAKQAIGDRSRGRRLRSSAWSSLPCRAAVGSASRQAQLFHSHFGAFLGLGMGRLDAQDVLSNPQSVAVIQDLHSNEHFVDEGAVRAAVVTEEEKVSVPLD